jgi:predicted DNA-binding ribbon-helix-helix protein
MSMLSSLPSRQPRRTAEPGDSSLVIRNVVVAGRRTSVRLEPMMWESLHDIARQRHMTLHQLVTEIDRNRTASSLTAGIRVYIVAFYRSAAARGGWISGASAIPPTLGLPA